MKRGDFNSLLLAAMSILIIVDTATQSYLNIAFFGDGAFGISLAICFGVILAFVGLALHEKDVVILTLFAGIVGFYISYYLYFGVNADRSLGLNALGSYYGLLSVIVFYLLAKRNLLPVAMEVFFYVYASYLLLYLVLVETNLTNAGGLFSAASEKISFILTDDARDSRLVMHIATAPYVAMYSIAKLQERVRLRYIAALAVACYACNLYSRALIVCLLGVAALFVITRRLTLVQSVSFIAYLAIAIFLILGVLDPSFNPYSFANSDESLIARGYEYQVMVSYIRKYPLFGIGLPDATPGLTRYLGAEVYPEDLGIIGTWFTFGLFGVCIVGVAGAYLSCRQNNQHSVNALGVVNARALGLSGCVIGLYSVMSGNTLLVGSALVFSLIVANAFYSWNVSRH